MSNASEIDLLAGLLTTHRKALAIRLEQLATHSPAYTPPAIFHDIDNARAEIDRLKTALRAAGAIVEDQPTDIETDEEQAAHQRPPMPRLIIGDIVAGNKISGDYITGNKTEVHHPAPDPLPPVDLAEATQRLAGLPTDVLPAVRTLPPSSQMPLASNALFTGRENELRELARALQAQRTSVVAAEMGGVGKTSLAVEFVHRYGYHFAGGVFWLSFAEPASIPAQIATCGGAAGLRLPGFDALDFDTQVQRVLAEWREDMPRLLIFDNWEDPALLRQYRPTTGWCRVLITSRDPIWPKSAGVHLLELEVLPHQS